MSIESSADWEGVLAVSSVVRRTLTLLEAAVEPGVTTGDLDRLAAAFIRSCGARSAPAQVYGFPGTVLISVNEEVVHGVPGRRVIAPDDVVSIDVTLELNGYVADAARTVIAGGGTTAARRLVECAEAAFHAGLRTARAGAWVREIGRAVEGEVRRRGFAVVRGLSGHGVGRTIHEPPTVPNEWNPRLLDRLTDGLVITIEPLVSAGSADPVEELDGWTIRTADRSIAAHHEETVVVTHGRPIVLTGAAA